MRNGQLRRGIDPGGDFSRAMQGRCAIVTPLHCPLPLLKACVPVAHERYIRARLGLRLDHDADRLRNGRMAPQVIVVRPRGPAALAGVKPGDLMVKANGFRIRRPADLRLVLESVPPGKKIQLTLSRDCVRWVVQVQPSAPGEEYTARRSRRRKTHGR